MVFGDALPFYPCNVVFQMFELFVKSVQKDLRFASAKDNSNCIHCLSVKVVVFSITNKFIIFLQQNRKNDEASYEKMLKLRRDLSRAVTILEMIKKREKSKRELLHLTLEIVEKRYEIKDFSHNSDNSFFQ